MKTIGIIPARGGSKGIPQKNIKLLCGKPLIFYSIDAALKSNLDRVIVSTDDQLIKEISIKYGAEVIDRPAELANDTAQTLPVLLQVLKSVNEDFDAVMTLQPTSPLRTYIHINEALNVFDKDSKADSLVSVVKVPHNFSPDKLMNYNGKYLAGNLNVKRRQDTDTSFARNGAAIYMTKIDKIKQYIIGGNILPYFMNKIDSIDIDDDEDFKMAEILMQKINFD